MHKSTSLQAQLNKYDLVPLYAQLEKLLRNEILSGKYQPGELIPSENVLSRELGITRTTVRKAIELLAKDGIIEKVRGKGSRVAFKRLRHNIWNFTGFTDHLRRQNLEPVSRVLEKTTSLLDGHTYMKLVRARGVRQGTDVQNMTIDTSLIPLDIFPGIDSYDFARESLYSTMRERYSVFPHTATIKVMPVLADKQAAEIFLIPLRTPLIFAIGSAFSDTGAEIEKIKVLYGPAMDFNLSVEIGH